jgi:hypothetical protein
MVYPLGEYELIVFNMDPTGSIDGCTSYEPGFLTETREYMLELYQEDPCKDDLEIISTFGQPLVQNDTIYTAAICISDSMDIYSFDMRHISANRTFSAVQITSGMFICGWNMMSNFY